MSEFQGVVPILRVNSLAASLAYYLNKLGFRKNWEWPGFASVSRGNTTIFLCQGGQGKPGMWMSVFMDDVDALYQEYKERGALIVEPPMNFPWGHREMLVTDLDGHRLRMSGKPTGPPDEGHESTERARAT
jgi:predicted enzyme related to lactoylglutathione lyase